MSSCFIRYVTKLDYFSGPKVHKSIAGGLIAIGTYIILLGFFIYYILKAMSSEYPLNTAVFAFPDTVDDAYTMPSMKCVATNGCFVKSQMGGPTGGKCTFLNQGDTLPESERKLHYSSDPVESFTVLSTDFNENFALSYDVETVTKYANPLETSLLEAARDFSPSVPIPYKIYRGTSLMNLIETEAVNGEVVHTWLNTVTSEVSSFTGSDYCCSQTVYYANGTTNAAKTSEMSGSGCMTGYNSGIGWWGTKIQPPTTYTRITLVDPWDVGLLVALVGGWLGLLASVGAAVFWLYEKLFVQKEKSDGAGAAGETGQRQNGRDLELTKV
jgi:hypothetical protein